MLQGLRTERDFDLARRTLGNFELVEIVGADIALQAAKNFRVLRGLGVTVHKTIDTVIATKCIEAGYPLLYSDGDFDPFAAHLGLQVAYSQA